MYRLYMILYKIYYKIYIINILYMRFIYDIYITLDPLHIMLFNNYLLQLTATNNIH